MILITVTMYTIRAHKKGRPIIIFTILSIPNSGDSDSELSCSCCFNAAKFFHVSLFLRSLHWLKIKERIRYKLLSLTYKVLTTSQPSCLRDLLSVQPTRCTRSSSVVTLARPSFTSSVKITNLCFRHASPRLWNAEDFRLC